MASRKPSNVRLREDVLENKENHGWLHQFGTSCTIKARSPFQPPRQVTGLASTCAPTQTATGQVIMSLVCGTSQLPKKVTRHPALCATTQTATFPQERPTTPNWGGRVVARSPFQPPRQVTGLARTCVPTQSATGHVARNLVCGALRSHRNVTGPPRSSAPPLTATSLLHRAATSPEEGNELARSPVCGTSLPPKKVTRHPPLCAKTRTATSPQQRPTTPNQDGSVVARSPDCGTSQPLKKVTRHPLLCAPTQTATLPQQRPTTPNQDGSVVERTPVLRPFLPTKRVMEPPRLCEPIRTATVPQPPEAALTEEGSEAEPHTYTDVARMYKGPLNELCKKHGIRVKLGKQAKINLLCLKLGISTSGAKVEEFTPRDTYAPLSAQQQCEFCLMTPPYMEELSGWHKGLDQCPDIDDGNVKKYLLATNVLSPQQARTYKISRPYQLKAFVHSVNFNSLSSSPTFCLLRGQVNPSQSTSEDDVKTVFVILDKITGLPYGGYCTCTAGFCQSCGHMGALLFCLADVITEGAHKLPGDPTCTDVKCYWAEAKGAGVAPKKLQDMEVNQKKAKKTKMAMEKYKQYLNEQEQPFTYDEAKDLRLSLMAATGQSGVFVPAVRTMDRTRFGLSPHVPPLTPKLPSHVSGEDHALLYCADVTVSTGMPDPLANMFESLGDLDMKDTLVRQSLLDSIKFSQQDRDLIDTGTMSQNKNPQWYQQRRGAITSTQIFDIHKSLTPGSKINKARLVKECLGERFKYITAPPQPTAESLKWGITYEDKARDAYKAKMMEDKTHTAVCVKERGLLLHPVYPFIRTSPDGIVACSCCTEERLLEIKCPYVARNMTPRDGVEEKKIGFLELAGPDGYRLNNTNTGRDYYAQVQCTMAVTGCRTCDLFVWTLEGSITITVPFEASYWWSILASASSFYRDFVIPALVSGDNTEEFAMNPITVSKEVSDNQPCQQSTSTGTAPAQLGASPEQRPTAVIVPLEKAAAISHQPQSDFTQHQPPLASPLHRAQLGSTVSSLRQSAPRSLLLPGTCLLQARPSPAVSQAQPASAVRGPLLHPRTGLPLCQQTPGSLIRQQVPSSGVSQPLPGLSGPPNIPKRQSTRKRRATTRLEESLAQADLQF